MTMSLESRLREIMRQGAQGARGAQGAQGAQGAEGARGAQGALGAASRLSQAADVFDGDIVQTSSGACVVATSVTASVHASAARSRSL